MRPYSITSVERLVATIDAVDHVIARQVPGAFVECGVWRGGSVLAMVLELQHLGVDDRDIWLYDTFEGMTEPSSIDTSAFEQPALATWRAAQRAGERAWRWFFPDDGFGDEVRSLLTESGYPLERLHFVAGKVEDTIPDQAPDRLAILRLDTDWYESTRHELEHLYPRLVEGGVLLVDDYGHWAGCRRAVDEYFGPDGTAPPVLLARTDYTGRIAVKH